MVNVESAFWIVSEKMARLMEDWGITGYELQEVAHKGPSSGKVPCYLLVPIETLPAWSSKMPRIYFVTEEQETGFLILL
jgi:hypothetical protein